MIKQKVFKAEIIGESGENGFFKSPQNIYETEEMVLARLNKWAEAEIENIEIINIETLMVPSDPKNRFSAENNPMLTCVKNSETILNFEKQYQIWYRDPAFKMTCSP